MWFKVTVDKHICLLKAGRAEEAVKGLREAKEWTENEGADYRQLIGQQVAVIDKILRDFVARGGDEKTDRGPGSAEERKELIEEVARIIMRLQRIKVEMENGRLEGAFKDVEKFIAEYRDRKELEIELFLCQAMFSRCVMYIQGGKLTAAKMYLRQMLEIYEGRADFGSMMVEVRNTLRDIE